MGSKYSKISIGIFVLTILVVVLIFYNNQKVKNVNGNVFSVAKLEENNISNSFSLEKLNQKLSANVESLNIKDEENLTLKVANELTQQILSLNEDNDLSSGELVVPNEELFSNLIDQKIVDKYKRSFLQNFSPLRLAELKLIKDNPPFTSLQYFHDVLNVIYENKITDDIVLNSLQAFIDNEDELFISDLIKRFDSAIDQWKNMQVPNSYASLHLQLVNLMLLKKSIFSALYNSNEDPLNGLVAIQLLEDCDNQYIDWAHNLVSQLNKEGIY